MSDTAIHDSVLRAEILIGDEWIANTLGGEREHVNPATEEVQQTFPVAGASEVDAAVNAATTAFPEWRDWSGPQRRDALLRLASLMRGATDEIAAISTREFGSVQAFAPVVANLAADFFQYYAGWCDKNTGSTLAMPGMLNYTSAEPVGVVAVLLPWNSPFNAIGMKVAAALAAGCCVVIKTPELAPFSSTVFGRLCLEAGIPPGVVNVLHGGAEVGELLVKNRQIDKVTLTGSPATAQKVQATAAANLTPLTLELGGKSACLVFEDADLMAAATEVTTNLVWNAGQICLAPTRMLVHDSVYDQVLTAVQSILQQVTIGDPTDPKSMMGPVIDRQARDRIMGVIDAAKADRAGTLVHGGERVGERGFFVQPTVFADVDNASDLAQNEIFGPVLAVSRFSTEEEAVRLANDTRFGLAGYVHTRDFSRAHRVANRLNAGSIAINGGLGIVAPLAPFGGFKTSGYGKEGGHEGLMEFIRIKNINARLG